MLSDGQKLGAFIVPTGVGATVGGFAGDASVAARMLSQKCKLIVNPNVVNAACFSGINENMFYIEGFSLDEFFKGNINFIPSKKNKIGIVFDKSISKDVLNVHINTMNAVKTVYGIEITGYELTDNPVGVEFFIDKSGVSMGNVNNLDTIRYAGEKLLQKGADSLAIVCKFPEDEGADYANGIGVDPVGGVEAIISHYISKILKVPCAHAPAFENINISTDIVDPRCAAEYITPTFLPCILLGLSQAPKITLEQTGISIKDLDFLIVPYNSLGGIPVLEAKKHNIPIYAIQENKTVLNVTNYKLNINCTILNSYKDLLEVI